MFPDQREKLELMGGSAAMTFKNRSRRTLQVEGTCHFPQHSCLHALVHDAICDS